MANKMADGYMDEMIETCSSLNNQEKLNDEIFKVVAKEQGLDPNNVRGTGVIREFVPDFMKGDLCDRPERNARPFDDDDYGQGLLEDGIIFNSKNNDLASSGDSIFESSSSTDENQKNFFSRFFDFFGGVSDDNICPVNTEDYVYSDSPLMDKLCNMFGFFIPEGGGGGSYCPDPSKMVPPSPFLADWGDFGSDS